MNQVQGGTKVNTLETVLDLQKKLFLMIPDIVSVEYFSTGFLYRIAGSFDKQFIHFLDIN